MPFQYDSTHFTIWLFNKSDENCHVFSNTSPHSTYFHTFRTFATKNNNKSYYICNVFPNSAPHSTYSTVQCQEKGMFIPLNYVVLPIKKIPLTGDTEDTGKYPYLIEKKTGTYYQQMAWLHLSFWHGHIFVFYAHHRQRETVPSQTSDMGEKTLSVLPHSFLLP